MKLYTYWRSSSAWRVRIGLHWKGLPFETVAVNLLENDQWTDVHRARSPLGTIPVLELDDGRLLDESMAILHYLDEVHPDPPLLPRDPYLRARARMLAEMVNAGIQPLQNLMVQKHVKRVLGADEKAWAKHWIDRGMQALETAVAVTAGRFAVGDEPTLADVYIVPQLYAARRFGGDVEGLSTLLAIEAACATLAPFAAAHADGQPDTPRV
jgi:maleylpyruvate isomerase